MDSLRPRHRSFASGWWSLPQRALGQALRHLATHRWQHLVPGDLHQRAQHVHTEERGTALLVVCGCNSSGLCCVQTHTSGTRPPAAGHTLGWEGQAWLHGQAYVVLHTMHAACMHARSKENLPTVCVVRRKKRTRSSRRAACFPPWWRVASALIPNRRACACI